MSNGFSQFGLSSAERARQVSDANLRFTFPYEPTFTQRSTIPTTWDDSWKRPVEIGSQFRPRSGLGNTTAGALTGMLLGLPGYGIGLHTDAQTMKRDQTSLYLLNKALMWGEGRR